MRKQPRLYCFALLLLVAIASTGPAQVIYFEDFESGPGGWTAVGGGPLWQFGTPSQTNLNGALSGANAWMTDLVLDYPNFSDASVVSPVFDFSGCLFDPVLTFGLNYYCEFDYDGMVVEVDRNDGFGFQPLGNQFDSNWYTTNLTNGSDAFSGSSGGWIGVSHVLDSTAGNPAVVLRMRFVSDSSVTFEGAAIDDVEIFCPDLSPTTSYYQGFDFGAGGWAQTTGAPLWQVGFPSQSMLNTPLTGPAAVMTDLAFDYYASADASLEAPAFDFSQCPVDPVLDFYINQQTEQFYDGMRVEVDRNDGFGFLPLGSAADPNWYDGPLFDGGDGFTGSSSGLYRRVLHVIDGTAGNPLVRIRMRFLSDSTVNDEGVALDEIRIRCYCPGTETLAGEDITQFITLNGISNNLSLTALVYPGDLVSITTFSSSGTLDNLELLVLAEAFPTGNLPASPFPGICVSGTTQTIIVFGGPQPPLGVIPLLPPFGFTYGFIVPPGLAGVSLMTQSFVLAPFPFTANGIFASTDARILQFE